MNRSLALRAGSLMLGLLLAGLWAGCLDPAPAAAQSSMRSGESRVAVPNVKGKRQADAERILDEAGFSTVQIYPIDTDKRGLAGVVRDQKPLPGMELPVSTIMKLSVYRYEP